MSLFRRRSEEPAAAGPEAAPASASVPAARDPELAMPPFRPTPAQPKDALAMSLPPKPSAAPAPSPGLVPPRPAAAAPTPRPMTGERRTLVVGKGISLAGSVTDAERLVVEGTMESAMLHAAELIVAHSGVFKGEVEVEDAEIAGVFDGTLTARGSLTIRSTGKLVGTARSKRLSVEDGGQLSGRMEMLTEAAAATPAARTAMPPSMPAAVVAEAQG
jgi:cytoskeletal protein CcmA (bactofilin family)